MSYVVFNKTFTMEKPPIEAFPDGRLGFIVVSPEGPGELVADVKLDILARIPIEDQHLNTCAVALVFHHPDLPALGAHVPIPQYFLVWDMQHRCLCFERIDYA